MTESARNNSSAGSLAGQTVVLIGGTSGIGLAAATAARGLGAEVILTGRDPAKLERAAAQLGAKTTAAFDATDAAQLSGFFDSLSGGVDHIFVTAGGSYYSKLVDMDFDQVRGAIDEHLMLPLEVCRHAVDTVRPGGAVIFMTGTAARHPVAGSAIAGIFAAALPALVANLALEIGPIRVNLIAAGFVDTPLSAAILGGDLDKRRAELRATLPVRRVVEPEDVAALAIQLMTNRALTGSTYDVDGGQQLL